MGAMLKSRLIVIIMISTNKDIMKKIDWEALDRCWAESYEEDYGHCYADMSNIGTIMRSPIPAAIEASSDAYI